VRPEQDAEQYAERNFHVPHDGSASNGGRAYDGLVVDLLRLPARGCLPDTTLGVVPGV
jgi:hypothetical protein